MAGEDTTVEENNEKPQLSIIQGMIAAAAEDSGLSEMGFGGEHTTAHEYYDGKGHLKPEYENKNIGYKPHAVTFVAKNQVERVMAAIGTWESGGGRVGHVDYGAIGPPTRDGHHAYGAWQVMDRNLPEWGEEAGLGEVTLAKFTEKDSAGQITAAARQLQHDLVYHQIEKLLKKGYSPEDAASIWFTGHPVRAGDLSSDGYTTASTYVSRFGKALAQIKVDPSAPTTSETTVAMASPKPGDRGDRAQLKREASSLPSTELPGTQSHPTVVGSNSVSSRVSPLV